MLRVHDAMRKRELPAPRRAVRAVMENCMMN
jgi:hypothetical protein